MRGGRGGGGGGGQFMGRNGEEPGMNGGYGDSKKRRRQVHMK